MASVFAALFVILPSALPAASQPPSRHAPAFAGIRSNSPAPQASAAPVTQYTLPPEIYAKARRLGHLDVLLYFTGTLYGILVLLLILRFRIAVRFRDWAERFTSFRFVQAVIFAPLLLVAMSLLELPLSIYRHHLGLAYGLSVQHWGSWTRDWMKGQMVRSVVGILVVWVLYSALRRWPRRWWFSFWLALIPIAPALVFLQPLVVDPLFHHFEPLSRTDPALVAMLERVSQRAGVYIPPGRMFLMRASEKSTTLNAYVTGFGASKRIVVYDTTIARMTTPQIAFVFGHELGHYRLGHITQGLLFAAGLAFVLLWLLACVFGWLLPRCAAGLGIRGANDYASLPLLLLLVSVFAFFVTPAGNAFSRHIEHQADIYGLEVTHGLTPDSGEVAAQSFQILGEVDLSDPAPSSFARFWLYDHPSIGSRIRFALRYDPWDRGIPPRWVR